MNEKLYEKRMAEIKNRGMGNGERMRCPGTVPRENAPGKRPTLSELRNAIRLGRRAFEVSYKVLLATNNVRTALPLSLKKPLRRRRPPVRQPLRPTGFNITKFMSQNRAISFSRPRMAR